MIAVFFELFGFVYHFILEPQKTVTAKWYIKQGLLLETLPHMKMKIKEKQFSYN